MQDGKGVWRLWDKYRYAALVALAGVMLMLWPAGRSTEPDTGTTARDLQKEMEAVLSRMDGVGQVRVLLTEESDGERILAEDINLSLREDGGYSRNAEIVTTGGGPTVTRRVYPDWRGALVVCEGGDSAAVRLAVTRAVTALTGLSADRVAVEKWQ